MEFGVTESRGVPVVPEQGAGGSAPAEATREPVSTENQELLARVKQLEAQLERYRSHAERTSKLFQSVTSYADWVRESARRDAELALRKASARVEKLDAAARKLERTELALVRAQADLERVQALADETRARLSKFLEAGLDALSTEVVPDSAGEEAAPLGGLDESLREQVSSASTLGRVEEPAREQR